MSKGCRVLGAVLLLALALAGCAPAEEPPGQSAASPESPSSSSAPSQSVPPQSQPLPESLASEPDAPEGCRWLTITEAEVLTLINQERRDLGLAPLTYDSDLAAAARVRCRELYKGNYVAHTRPNGDPWETVLQEDVPVEYALAAENLAWSNHAEGESLTAFQWFSLWKESEDHYSAMVNPKYSYCGIAILTGPYFEGEDQTYATALFCSY